jgi:hypothetical protein
MVIKRLIAIAILCVATCACGEYRREVHQPVGVVRGTLAKLDPARPSGAQVMGEGLPEGTTIRHLRQPDGALAWQVLDGGKLAAQMTVTTEAIGDRRATRVYGVVTRFKTAAVSELQSGSMLETYFAQLFDRTLERIEP